MSFSELRGRSWGDGLGGFLETPRFRPRSYALKKLVKCWTTLSGTSS